MDNVTVTFILTDGREFSGSIRPMAIVHEAMDLFLPTGFMHNQRISIHQFATDDLIYPDMFVGEVHEQYRAEHGGARLKILATSLPSHTDRPRPWRNVGFDHLALSLKDRKAAVDFFSRGLGMVVMRDDEHISVVSAPTGNNALFFFEAEAGKPLSDGIPSQIHHIGFVVDDLEAAYLHLRANFPDFASDFTLLERLERWSMYGRITFGGIRFMIQLSQIKAGFRGIAEANDYTGIMYNYASRSYGVRFMPG